MDLFLAGYQASTTKRETFLIEEGGVTHRCISYANIEKIPGLPFFVKGIYQGYKVCVKKKVGIMMDSGVISYKTYAEYVRRTGKKVNLPDRDKWVEGYAAFCRKYGHLWDFYVTVDFRTNCAENLEIHGRLEKLGIRPTPVYHGDDELDYLRRYKDKGYDFICLGAIAQKKITGRDTSQYLDAVFNAGEKWGIKFHGLAVTTAWMVLNYPWQSCDSSSWSRVAGYGCIIRFDERTGRMDTLRVSDRHVPASQDRMSLRTNKSAWQRLQKELEDEGYDFGLLQTDHTWRHLYNARTMQKLAAAAGTRQRGWRKLF